MKIPTWDFDMTHKETADLAYWERNVLALYFADPSKGDGWYHDDAWTTADDPLGEIPGGKVAVSVPRFAGWRRVVSLRNGSITFHVKDTFDLGNLPQIERNWDGHTTEEKWRRMLEERGVKSAVM